LYNNFLFYVSIPEQQVQKNVESLTLAAKLKPFEQFARHLTSPH